MSSINRQTVPLLITKITRLLPQYAISLVVLMLLVIIWRGAADSSYNWQWFRIPRLLLPGMQNGEWVWGPLVEGLKLTFILAIFSVPLASIIGLVCALLEKNPLVVLRWISRSYVELMRNTPLLVQLYLLYFMFANLIGIDRVTAGILALALFEGAFAAEIFRSGIDSIPRGQQDAARALGLSSLQSFRLVYLPLSMPLILPPLTNLFVALIKHSSIVTVVALPELTYIARNLIADTYLTFEIWLVIAIIYVVLCFGLSIAIKLWENKLVIRFHGRKVHD